jgi:hypothetical protein
MWFMFGGITLVVIIFYKFFNQYLSLWVGKKVTGESGTFEYRKKVSRNGWVNLKVGIRINEKLNFTLRRENRWDQYFKSIKLSREHQVGWKKFDDEIYVISDSEAIFKGFLNNKVIQRSLLKLFKSGFDNRINIAKLHCNGGRLWAEIEYSGSLNDKVEENYELIASELRGFALVLNKIEPSKYKEADPYFFRSAILLAISSGLFINAIFQLSRIYFSGFPITVDMSGLLAFSTLTGVTITGILTVLAWRLLKSSSRAHLVLLEIITFGCLGAIGSSVVQLRELNTEWDDSPPTRFETSIVRKSIEENRKGNKTYTLYLSGWPSDGDVNGLAVNVTGSMFYRVKKGFPIAIVQHEGYLGLSWIKSIHALKLLKESSKQKYEIVSEEDKIKRKYKLSGFSQY